MDPYKILGVKKTATQDEIKSAYRDLAKKYHPDLNPEHKASEHKFKDITVAYDLIGTPESRSKYDKGEYSQADDANAQWQQQRRPFYYETQGPGRYSSSESNFDADLFESLFGARGRASQARPPDIYQLEIEQKDAILGGEKEVTLPSGKKLSIRIPPGVTSETRLKINDQLYIELLVKSDHRFIRQGDDLLTELPVSLTEAVFGGDVRAPTVDGEVMLKVPRHSNTGTRLRIPGKGVFNRMKNRRGDQITTLKVMLPKVIDPELEEALRQWVRRRGAA